MIVFYISMIAIFIVAMIAIVVIAIKQKEEAKEEVKEKINAYNAISIGDSKESVIEKLGSGFTKSVLKDGTEKYVWVLQKGSSSYSGYSYKGMHTGGSTYSGVKKCTIKFKNNKVSEISGLNLGD